MITNTSETFDIPEKTWDMNYEGTLTVFETDRDDSVEEFVNAVTCSVCGTTSENIEEDFQCDPESPTRR